MTTLLKLFLFVFVLSSFLFFPHNSNAQVQNDDYSGFYSEFQLRQPSARSEAMGRGILANNENEFSSFYNPAQTSLGKGLDVNFSISDRILSDNGIQFSYIGATYNDKKLGAFGLSRNHLRYFIVTDETGRDIGERASYSIYTLNYSREIYEGLYAGVNFNIAHTLYPVISGVDYGLKDAFPVDIGLFKKIQIKSAASPYLSQSIQLASSVYNITSAKAKTNDGSNSEYILPVIFRLGGSYNLALNKSSDSKLLNVFVHLGYENYLNGKGFNNIKGGAEVTLFDILALRAGYFSRDVESIYPEFEHQFTYGAGLKIPMDAILKQKSPVSVSIDYVNMNQPFPDSFYEGNNAKNFNTVAVRLNYIPQL